jgi:ATP-binding cassette subfamily F protein 3
MLVIQNLSKSFGSRKIIRDFSYVFPETGIIALIGVNGAGKTTLLNILTGQEKHDSGTIIHKKDKKFGYLPQEPNQNPESTLILECCAGNKELFELQKAVCSLEEELATNYNEETLDKFQEAEEKYKKKQGYSFEEKAKKILIGLGFKKEQLNDTPKSLSGGWRMRLEIAKLLIQDLDLLILDEPTNHLDLPSIEWLEGYLNKFAGAVLFVSHDESILNRLPDKILALEGGFVKEYVGTYEDYIEQKTNFESNKEKQVTNIQKKIKQLSKFVDRFKAKAALAKQAQSKMKMIERLHDQINDLGPNVIQPELHIKIPLTTPSHKEVLQFFGDIGYSNEKPLLKKFTFTIKREQKIGIIGGNGLGKSTLIKTIINEIKPLAGEMQLGGNVNLGYYAQDQAKSLDETKSVIENMRTLNGGTADNKLLKILGSFLFKNEDVHKPVRLLSGGEKSRLSLASLLLRDLNFLVLDEPTNHLDIMSTQILAEALRIYEGTVVFVSHNRIFIDTVATDLLVFENGDAHIQQNN